MARTAKRNSPPLVKSKETLGQRIVRLRKERGYTQAELAEKVGTIQRLISDYERDKLRPHPDMIISFSFALEVSADELLGIKASKNEGEKPSLRITQRIKKIEALPPAQQKTLLKTIDTFIKAAQT
jgi:transcriptional regulator with XRE-family HTH domain